MTEKYTLGIDIGTTGVKASVLDVDAGKVAAHSLKEHPLFHPKPGYAEQEGDNYWKAVVAAIKDCFNSIMLSFVLIGKSTFFEFE